MSGDVRSALAGAAAVAALVGAGAGFVLGARATERRHALDVVEVLTAPHAVPAPVDARGHAVHASVTGGHVVIAAPAGEHARRGSNPPVVRHVSGAADVHDETAYPAGGAVVAGAGDHAGVRRKPSLDRAPGAPVIVGVAGASGSGKTSIASLIAARLGYGAHVVALSCDSYYRSVPADIEPADYNFDHPSSVDFELLAQHLEALRRREDVQVPEYDFVHHRRTDSTTAISGTATSVVILDGIFVLHDERVRAACDLTLFCVEDSDVCLARRLRRDIVERGRTVESVLTQYLRFVKAGFTQFVAPTMTLADIIVPRARENATAIDMLARELQRRVDGLD